jgi:hypothetical protein
MLRMGLAGANERGEPRTDSAVVGIATLQATGSGAAVGAVLMALTALASGPLTHAYWVVLGVLVGPILGAPTGVVVGVALVVGRWCSAGIALLRVVAGCVATMTSGVFILNLFRGGSYDRNSVLWLGAGLLAAGLIAAWRTPSILYRRPNG